MLPFLKQASCVSGICAPHSLSPLLFPLLLFHPLRLLEASTFENPVGLALPCSPSCNLTDSATVEQWHLGKFRPECE